MTHDELNATDFTGSTLPMTHNELLAKITPRLTYSPNLAIGAMPILNALRAVVELHKPQVSEYFDKDICVACTPDIDTYFYYPCPTIQAIEKALT